MQNEQQPSNTPEAVIDCARSILQQKSDQAIANGNRLEGFLSIRIEQFDKVDLIMMLNILTDEIQRLKKDKPIF